MKSKSNAIIIFLILILILDGLDAFPQIIYNNFTPNISVSNQPGPDQIVDIDVDQDNITDFTAFAGNYWVWSGPNCCSGTRNQINHSINLISFAADTSASANCACNRIYLDSGAVINSNLYFPNNLISYFNANGPLAICGICLPYTPKFYPFVKYFNNDTLYGWIRASSTQYTLTIYDAALNLTPNNPIVAGFIPTSLNEFFDNESIHVIYNQNLSSIIIESPENLNCDFIIRDELGRIVLKSKVSEKNNSIIVNEFISGIYFYSLQNNQLIQKSGKLAITKF